MLVLLFSVGKHKKEVGMKARSVFSGKVFRAFVSVAVLLFSSLQLATAQDWFDINWSNRQEVSITHPVGTGGAILYDYQVKISLNSSNFDFSGALTDGSDIRFTASDGVTAIPYWIEEWDQAGESGVVWIKVPLLPVEGLTVYLYYGNPDMEVRERGPVATPPIGPFAKNNHNPIDTIAGSPYDASASLLAENIVYDEVTGHFWMVFANYEDGSIGLIWSDDPTNPQAWNWHTGNPLFSGNAPHIMEHNGTWYIFYASGGHIVARTSSSVGGPYSSTVTTLLEDGDVGTWEDERVDEPYVFQRNDGKWVMLYMGDAGGAVEQVSYATADDILGTYTKFGADPFIPFGPAGSYDAGTVADPWVYEFNGVYYAGYTVSPTTHSPWQTAVATTTDWQTINKLGVILPTGTEFNSFRGAVTRIGDEYVFSYTGGTESGEYRLCIATQPVYQSPARYSGHGDDVFDFFDGFEKSYLDAAKWNRSNGSELQTFFDGDYVTMRGINGTYIRIDGRPAFGRGYIGETRGRHANNAAANMIIEYGFASSNSSYDLRLTDNYTTVGRYQKYVYSRTNNFGPATDHDWHTYAIYRANPDSAVFKVDNDTALFTSVTGSLLHPFLMSYSRVADSVNLFIVDWTRVRKWASGDATATVSAATDELCIWDGSESTGWSTGGNWSGSTVPGSTDHILIPSGAANFPELTGDLIIDPQGSLTIAAGASLTVNGALTTNDRLVIESSVSSGSGSLIVNGNADGLVTYNRYLREGDNVGDKHLFSSPVGGQSVADIIERYGPKIDSVRSWNELSGVWERVQSGEFISGKGYNVYQGDESDGEYSFTGSLVTTASFIATSPFEDPFSLRGDDPYGNDDPATINWTDGRGYIGTVWENWGGGGWNLLGNPFTSALKITDSDSDLTNDFLNVNNASFDPSYVAAYIYDGVTGQYYYRGMSTGFVDPTVPPNQAYIYYNVQAGQGFFVMANDDQALFSFNPSMQIHRPAIPIMKSARAEESWPGLQLKVKKGNEESLTTVFYNDAMNTGLDPGYDVGKFGSGTEVELYTLLVNDDNGVNFARQALPVSGADKIFVPVGIDSEKGGEVTFSAYSVPGVLEKFWLEDRLTGTFTDLTTKSYTVTLPANTYGTGRFFIIASANTPTGVEEEPELPGLRIWVYDYNLIIKGEVSVNARCEIYNQNGGKIMERRLSDGELNTIGLPPHLHGVYFVRVTDGMKTKSQKIVIF